jgi:hypothetical protein
MLSRPFVPNNSTSGHSIEASRLGPSPSRLHSWPSQTLGSVGSGGGAGPALRPGPPPGVTGIQTKDMFGKQSLNDR